MTVYHDEVEIEDFEYDKDDEVFTYPCVSALKTLKLLTNFSLTLFVFALFICSHAVTNS